MVQCLQQGKMPTSLNYTRRPKHWPSCGLCTVEEQREWGGDVSFSRDVGLQRGAVIGGGELAPGIRLFVAACLVAQG